MTLLEVKLDGRTLTVSDDVPLLVALERAGFRIPHVCYHPSLGAIQTCDLCYVEVDGKLVRSCTTKAHSGADVKTQSARVQAIRKAAMHKILTNHNLLLYDMRQQQRRLRASQHGRANGSEKSEFQKQALSRRRHKPVLRVRPEPVHFVWSMRRSVSRLRGKRSDKD